MCQWRLPQKYNVLPKSIDGGRLFVYCLDVTAADLDAQRTLEFAIGSPICCTITDRSTLNASLSHYYPALAALIRNCPIEFRFQCPMTWNELTPTNDNLVRRCNSCGRDVHLCTAKTDANRIGRRGDCIAFADPELGTFLGEVELDF